MFLGHISPSGATQDPKYLKASQALIINNRSGRLHLLTDLIHSQPAGSNVTEGERDESTIANNEIYFRCNIAFLKFC